VKECVFGQGLFAKRYLPPLTFIGQYYGTPISREKYKQKATTLGRFVDYCAEVPNNPNFLYDPTDEEGQIMQKFKNNVCIYINEPPPQKLNNCAWVFTTLDSFEETTLLEIWTFREIQPEEELYIFYGEEYHRNYEINWEKEACGSNYYNFSICEKKKGIFFISEYPGWLQNVVVTYFNNQSDFLQNKRNLFLAPSTKSILVNSPLLMISHIEDNTLVLFLYELDKINKEERKLK